MTSGKLYLVGVSIGNYGDMTYRAVETLKSVDVIAAEDTRKARHLLTHFQIKPEKLIAHHAHNEADSAKGLLTFLNEGKSIALITDAGMPTISDPGYQAAKHVRAGGGVVEVIPGVSAVPTALAASGLPAEDFRFIGFLPRKSGDIKKVLQPFETSQTTLVLFESPRRIVKALEAIAQQLGERQTCLCRELTKQHEEFIGGTITEVLANLNSRDAILGEMTLVVEGAAKDAGQKDLEGDDLESEISTMLEQGMKTKEIRDVLADKYGLNKGDVYQKTLEIQKK